MLRKGLCILSCCLCLSAPQFLFAASTPESQVLKASGEVIVNAHKNLVKSVETIKNSISSICTSEQFDLKNLRTNWHDVASNWSAVKVISFGPIDHRNAGWKFQFWPDPINLLKRKLDFHLNKPADAFRADEIASGSKAIHGVSALEYLLFDHSVPMEPNGCGVLQATADNLLTAANEITYGWEMEYMPVWLGNAEEDAINAQRKLNMEILLSSVIMGIGQVKNENLGKPLGLPAKFDDQTEFKVVPRLPLLEAWRSETSLRSMIRTLEFSQKLYSLELGLGWYLRNKSKRFAALDSKIMAQFDVVINQFKSVPSSIVGAINKQEYGTIVAAYKELTKLYFMLRTDYTKASQLQFRFNARDGD